MPTFSNKHRPQTKPWLKPFGSGFTLLELLVALVIISLMVSVVGFGVVGNSARSVKYEAQKLAARLNAAQNQVVAGSTPLRLIATAQGYAFEKTERASDGSASFSWTQVQDDDILAPRTLPEGAVLVLPAGGALWIPREPISQAMTLRLRHAQGEVLLQNDGVNGWLSP